MRHLGKGSGQGHYIAEVMDWITGVWYKCDDEKVTQINDNVKQLRSDSEGRLSKSGNISCVVYVERGYLGSTVQQEISNPRLEIGYTITDLIHNQQHRDIVIHDLLHGIFISQGKFIDISQWSAEGPEDNFVCVDKEWFLS